MRCRAGQRSLRIAFPRSATARPALVSMLRVAVSGSSAWPLTGDVSAEAGAGVALVGQGGQAVCGCTVESGQGVRAGGGDVVRAAGFDRRGPHREAGWVAHDLDVAAVLLVLAGVPQVVARL